MGLGFRLLGLGFRGLGFGFLGFSGLLGNWSCLGSLWLLGVGLCEVLSGFMGILRGFARGFIWLLDGL